MLNRPTFGGHVNSVSSFLFLHCSSDSLSQVRSQEALRLLRLRQTSAVFFMILRLAPHYGFCTSILNLGFDKFNNQENLKKNQTTDKNCCFFSHFALTLRLQVEILYLSRHFSKIAFRYCHLLQETSTIQ